MGRGDAVRPIAAGGAGRIACRVVLAVLTFRHRSAVQGFPCRGQAFLVRLSDRRSPVEAMRSVGVVLAVKERRGRWPPPQLYVAAME